MRNCWVLTAISHLENGDTNGKTDYFYQNARISIKKIKKNPFQS
jgi:hypothetical protein